MEDQVQTIMIVLDMCNNDVQTIGYNEDLSTTMKFGLSLSSLSSLNM